MSSGPIPLDDIERVAALRRYCVLDTAPEPAFDRVTHIVQHVLRVPTALVSLVDSERQWFKARIGLDAAETSRAVSFCSHAIFHREVLVVPDARLDRRFADNPLVTGAPGIRFYAGAPLITPDGFALGTICAIDYVPRPSPPEAEIVVLRMLADSVVDALELRASARALAERERALLKNSRLLQTTMDAVGQGISAFDADLKLVALNGKLIELLDLPPELGRIGTDFATIAACVAQRGSYGPGDADDWVAMRVAAVRRGEPHRLELARPDGHIIEMRGFPVSGGGRVTTYTDVTEERRSADELRRRLAERDEIARLKNEFVSTVSHELRTPLTSIAGALELLDAGVGGTLPPDASELVGVAYNNSQRLIRLVNDILDIEKIEAGRTAFEIKPCLLAPLLERAVAEMAPYGENLGVRFQLRILADRAMALVDTDRFIQVITNLLSNAAKFSPKGETVTVTLDRSSEALRVSVADRGPGIPDAFRCRIFEKFAQADGSDDRCRAGSGLGLAIVKNIVEHLGGAVGFETRAGGGTNFHVDLPEWYATDAATEAVHANARSA